MLNIKYRELNKISVKSYFIGLGVSIFQYGIQKQQVDYGSVGKSNAWHNK